MNKRRWRDLSGTQQKAILTAAAVEAACKIVALVDLRRRPASGVRGPKVLWATAIVVVNTGGPLAYFTSARRR
ncbi:MAG TPA: PLDc N-terminal domain-containing protein [Sporichthyaceae bacterium]